MLTFNKIKGYYDKGYWTKEMVANAVTMKKITKEEYKEIVGEDLE